MNETIQLIRSGHQYFTFAVSVEGIPDLWIGRNWTGSVGIGQTTRSVLAIRELAPVSGSGDPFRGLADPAQVTLHLQDTSGYIKGLFASGTQTTLAAPVEPTDDTITLTDASGFPTSGIGWLQRECVSWTGKSGNALTGVTRALYSDRAAGRYPELTNGVLPPYRFGDTPMWLDGRIISVYASPCTVTGEQIYSDSPLQVMVWRGVIQSAPYSLAGVDWTLQCAGLERLLQGNPHTGSSKATLPGGMQPASSVDSGIFITEAANTMVFDYSFVVAGNVQHQALQYTLPSGRLGISSIQALGNFLASAAFASPSVSYNNGVFFISFLADPSLSPMLSPRTDQPNSAFGHWSSVDVSYDFYGSGGPLSKWEVRLSFQSPSAYYVPPTATVLPIFTSGPLDWLTSGAVECRGEQIGYGSLTYAQEVGDGRSMYYLGDLQRSVNGEVATEYRETDPAKEGPSVEVGLPFLGDSAVEAIESLIADLPALGDEFYSAQPLNLQEQPLPAGPLDSLLKATSRMGDAVGDSAALDGCMIAAGMDDDGVYRLLAVRPGNQQPISRDIQIDWEGQTQTQSGLGRSVTTVIVRLPDGSQVTATDLPTLLAVGTVQSRELEGRFRPSVDSLTAAGAAGYALLRKWGRPGLILECELGPEYRDLRVGDNVSLQLPDGLERQWVVLRTQPSWAGRQPHCRVTLWQCHTWDTVWYAPAAVIESVDGDTVTCTTEDPLYSPWRPGELALQIEWFSVGDFVRFIDPDTDSDGVSAYEIESIDLDTGEVVLSGAPGAVTGHIMVHDGYSTATATSQARYAWIAATGTKYHEWGG